MSRPSEDDRDAVDRAFAELVARYHLTSDRPDPLESAEPSDAAAELDPLPGAAPTTTRTSPPEADGTAEASSTEHPPPAPTAAGPTEPDPVAYPAFHFVPADEVEPPVAVERFVPQPPLPLPRPTWPVLVAWIAMGYAVLAVLAAAMGVDLPRWAGWIALVGFLGGFGLLITRLPRNRPPDAGDGAVL